MPRRTAIPIAVLFVITLGLVLGILTVVPRTETLAPAAVKTLGSGGDPLYLVVMAAWPAESFCPGEFTGSVIESADRVTVLPVVRTGRVLQLGWKCAGLGTVQGRVGVLVKLDAPLGTRKAFTQDGTPLPVEAPPGG